MTDDQVKNYLVCGKKFNNSLKVAKARYKKEKAAGNACHDYIICDNIRISINEEPSPSVWTKSRFYAVLHYINSNMQEPVLSPLISKADISNCDQEIVKSAPIVGQGFNLIPYDKMPTYGNDPEKAKAIYWFFCFLLDYCSLRNAKKTHTSFAIWGEKPDFSKDPPQTIIAAVRNKQILSGERLFNECHNDFFKDNIKKVTWNDLGSAASRAKSAAGLIFKV